MRPTDFCHPIELRVPASRAFPARYRTFRCVEAPRSRGSVRHNRGTRRFTAPETASVDRHRTRDLERSASRLPDRAWAFSSHGARCDRPSDTPVASPYVVLVFRFRFVRRPLRRPPPSRGAVLDRYVLLDARSSLRVREPPRPRSSPLREKRRLNDDPGCLPSERNPSQNPVAITAPGPRPLHPVTRTKKPLDDALTSPWVHAGARPLFLPVSPTTALPFARRGDRLSPTTTPG